MFELNLLWGGNMANFIVGILNGLIKGLGAILSTLFFFLPPSPFTVIDNSPVAEYLPYINYLLPISEVIVILSAWVTAIGIYYIYQIALRWIKAIK
ncbi:hypothetical protein D3C81_537260 [compost metagenome]